MLFYMFVDDPEIIMVGLFCETIIYIIYFYFMTGFHQGDTYGHTFWTYF